MPLFAKASDGRVVRARNELDNTDLTFTCLGCNDRMCLVKGGIIRGTHFRHIVAKGETMSCSGGESDIHKLAKMLIVEHLSSISFVTKCECNMPVAIRFGSECKAVEEQSFGTRKLDVGILQHIDNEEEKVIGGIEVHHTHLVDKEKKKDLTKLQWLEVEAEEVIRVLSNAPSPVTNDYMIRAINSNLVDCIACKQWRVESDALFAQTNGEQRIVRRYILPYNGKHFLREPFVEHLIMKGKFKGQFFSDIAKYNLGVILHALTSPDLRTEHRVTCSNLMYGHCYSCGKFNPLSLIEKWRTFCKTCYSSKRG